MPQVGEPAPQFSLAGTSGDVRLQDALAGVRRLIIAFYPKDNTSG